MLPNNNDTITPTATTTTTAAATAADPTVNAEGVKGWKVLIDTNSRRDSTNTRVFDL